MPDEHVIRDSAPALQLFRQLGVRPPPPQMTVLDTVLPVIDVTPVPPQLLDSVQIEQRDLTGSFDAPVIAPRLAQARFPAAAGAAIGLDAIGNIPAGCVFRVFGGMSTNRPLSAGALSAIAGLQNQAGTILVMQWSQFVCAEQAFEFRSGPMSFNGATKLRLDLAAGAAGESHQAWYGIEVLQLRQG